MISAELASFAKSVMSKFCQRQPDLSVVTWDTCPDWASPHTHTTKLIHCQHSLMMAAACAVWQYRNMYQTTLFIGGNKYTETGLDGYEVIFQTRLFERSQGVGYLSLLALQLSGLQQVPRQGPPVSLWGWPDSRQLSTWLRQICGSGPEMSL